MGWPEAFLAAFNVVQVLGLAYIGYRQSQVKRDLNGSADEVQMQLIHLHDLIAGRVKRVPGVDPLA